MTTIACPYEKEYKDFINSLKNTHPNNTNSDILNALWYAKKNQWNTKSKNQIRYEKEQKRKKNRR